MTAQELTDADREAVAAMERARAAEKAAEDAKFERDCLTAARR
ncbi:hypothetical protein [Streptomyces sp. NPDC058653]